MAKRKRRILPKIMITGLAIYTAVNLLHLQVDINAAKQEAENLREEVDRQKRENAKLEESANIELDDYLIAQAARSELGLVSPGEHIFVDISN
jgi:cell division protein FtsB